MSSFFRADLHCHTTASDGSETPEELVRHAAEIGLQGLSITDHDTVDAYSTAIPVAKILKFPLLTGVEFSTVFEKEAVHVLAYGFALTDPTISELVISQKKRREERNKKILSNLKKLGIEISEEELGTELNHTIGRPHIAMAMMKKGVIRSLREGFDRYLGEGKAAYDPGVRMDVQTALSQIKKAKAIAVLAHPHLVTRKKALRALFEMPFDGLECYYACMKKEAVQPFVDRAAVKGWIATGGSDYHGKIKPQIVLGASWVGEETFRKLYDHYQRNETQS